MDCFSVQKSFTARQRDQKYSFGHAKKHEYRHCFFLNLFWVTSRGDFQSAGGKSPEPNLVEKKVSDVQNELKTAEQSRPHHVIKGSRNQAAQWLKKIW